MSSAWSWFVIIGTLGSLIVAAIWVTLFAFPATTEWWTRVDNAALERLVDLEYTAVEIFIHETGGHIKPSEVLADPERAASLGAAARRRVCEEFSLEQMADRHLDLFERVVAAKREDRC